MRVRRMTTRHRVILMVCSSVIAPQRPALVNKPPVPPGRFRDFAILLVVSPIEFIVRIGPGDEGSGGPTSSGSFTHPRGVIAPGRVTFL